VPDDEPVGHPVVPPLLLGEGEGLAGEAPGALAQGVAPAFHVCGLPGLLAGAVAGPLREDRRIRLPEVAEAAALASVRRRIAVQSQCLSLRRSTNDQASPNSSTPPPWPRTGSLPRGAGSGAFF